MRDWLTYRLSDFLLFSARTYFRMFELYHRDVWPAQVAGLLVAALIVVVLVRPVKHRHRILAFALAAVWLWVGVAFHIRRYASINWAATYFGALFVAQAALLALSGLRGGRARVAGVSSPTDQRAGIAFVGAVLLVPLVGALADRSSRQVEIFGLTPDATAIATIALLAFKQGGGRTLLILPVVWCTIGAATLWALSSREAWLSIAAVLVGLLALLRGRPQAV